MFFRFTAFLLMTLEQMLESIGEPVKNWRKKNKN